MMKECSENSGISRRKFLSKLIKFLFSLVALLFLPKIKGRIHKKSGDHLAG